MQAPASISAYSAVNRTANLRIICGDWTVNRRMYNLQHQYIWTLNDWPDWRYDLNRLAEPMADVSRAQGVLWGRLANLGVAQQAETSRLMTTQDTMQTSAIEGENLDLASVRSSVARRLGGPDAIAGPVDRHVDGIVEMLVDATANANAPLTSERLFGWHAALFPTGYSGMSRITVGDWRRDEDGPMQVMSGPIGRQRIHFEAPPAENLPREMQCFLDWVNAPAPSEPAILRAALGHLWFVTIHPFDDGNGRIARAIGDLLLTRADGSQQRYYSMSAQIQRDRKGYYETLQRTQRGTLDVTDWLLWFLETLHRAVALAHETLDEALERSRFWQRVALLSLNKRQVRMLRRLQDGFEGKLTSSKWARMAKCSPDTALRDINDLLEKGVLMRLPGSGRSTAYGLAGDTAHPPI